MKAALLVRPGEVIVREVPEPEVGPGEVCIAVGGVGLCGSDVSVFSGRWKAPTYPWLMGHEAFGTIVAAGEHVASERVGETVVLEPNIVCFTCDQCRLGRTSACLARRSVGMNRAGALAERLVVPAAFAWSVPAAPPADLVCVEPLTVVEAALRRLPSPLPSAALVVGTGPQGLLMCLALVGRGVEVHAHDIAPARMAFAEGLGVRTAPTEEHRQFGLVVDTVGSPVSVDFSLGRLAIGGTLLFLGLDSRPWQVTAQTLVRRQIHLFGSLTYDHPVDFERSLALIADGMAAPGRIVSDEYPLDDVQRAFEGSGSAGGKTWIRVAPEGS